MHAALCAAVQRWPQLEWLDLYESPVVTDAAVKEVAAACVALRGVQVRTCSCVCYRGVCVPPGKRELAGG